MKNELNVLIAGIDSVKRKNMHQLSGLGAYGYNFTVLTVDSMNDSKKVAECADNVEVVVCNRNLVRLSMLAHVVSVLFKRKIDIAEVYPYSVLQFLIALILKFFRVPVVLVARGVEYRYMQKMMPLVQRIAFRLTYLLADHVIYKELYMKEMLRQMGKRNYTMLTNSVNVPVESNEHKSAKCHFLFMNSFKFFRHPDVPLRAFLEICKELKLDSSSAIRFKLVGFMNKDGDDELSIKEKEIKEMVKGKDVPVELHGWTKESEKWISDSDVFLLPADVVFLNYSLLEAMARGVAPVVQDTDGSELIVTHNADGYVLPLDEELWREHMLDLIKDVNLRKKLGHAAREKIKNFHSLPVYLKKYDGIYKEVLRN